jgi:trehalose 6-phosphate phosphatase
MRAPTRVSGRQSAARRGAVVTRKRGGTRTARAAQPEEHADWAFFLDIDGTLLSFADTPAEVAVDSALKHTLERLYAATGGAVALISGRSIAQVDRLFAPLRFPVAGQHGLERRDGGGASRRHVAPSPRLAAIKRRLAPLAARHGGLVLEEKGLTLAVHYRRVPQLAAYLHRLLRGLVDSADNLRLQPGKMVLEIKPAGRDKGSTVVDFMAEQPFRGRVPVFIGDDLTDEHGFSVVNALGGHSVKVGPGRTHARWRFPDVRAVRAWLDRCASAGARVITSSRSTP